MKLQGKSMEIAKHIGQPLNPTLPVPVTLKSIANIESAGVGEKVWRYTAVDDTSDIVYNINADGSLDEVKRNPVGDAEVTFQGLNTKMEYVLVDDILDAADNTDVLAHRKASLTRGMDKKEVYTVIQGILGNSALGQANSNFIPGESIQSASVDSGDDLYDVIMNMKHEVEDYGDDFLLLVGSTVSEKIDFYSKENASTFNYDVGLREMLSRNGIKVKKVFGTFKDNASPTPNEYQVMGKKQLILVARNSNIQQGKPITFVRRRISSQLAELMNVDVDNAYRIVLSNDTPTIIDGSNTFAYAVWGYESVIFIITNPYAICTADATSIL